MKTKLKNLFPKIKRGGYSVQIRFMDEQRGERYFDSEWAVFNYGAAGLFTLRCGLNYRGEFDWNRPAAQSIGLALRAGDRVSISVTKHGQIGRPRYVGGRLVQITAVESQADGTVLVSYTDAV